MTRANGELRVYQTPAALARALADLFVETAMASIAARGTFAVSLAGGTTPKAAYRLLAEQTYARAIDWSRVLVFFGDERCVPPDDDRSNYKMAKETFLDALTIPRENIHRMRGEDDPADAAAAYRDELIETLGATPVFDLVMLGMGADGHTASLFPGDDPTSGDAMLVRAVYSSSQEQWRLTLTPRVLNAARVVVFVVEGAEKARALQMVRTGPHEPSRLPAQIIAPRDGALIWLADRAAVAAS